MYKEFFGLKDNPFSIAPNPQYLFMTPKHREALAHLLYGVQSSAGFVLLTGEVGTGKTTICRCFLQQIPQAVEVAFIVNPKLSVVELLETICDELGVSCYGENADAPDKPPTVKDYVDHLNAYLLSAHSRGHKTVLVIDEAQNLSVAVLEQLRLLTNLETDRDKLLQIVLIGQPELQEIFNRREQRQLAQRITARFHLTNLNFEETSAYVKHRLAIGGTERPIFNAQSIKLLYKLSGGIPRLINVMCDRALLGAYALSSPIVNKSIVQQATIEVVGKKAETKIKPAWLGMAAAASVVFAVGLLYVAADKSELAVSQEGGALLSSATSTKDTLSVDALGQAPLSISQIPNLPAPAAINRDYSVNFASDASTGTSLPTKLQFDPSDEIAQWPMSLSSTRSLYQSYIALFDLWRMSYSPIEDGGRPCDHAREQELQCLTRNGSVDALISLNRPAVLKVQTGTDTENNPNFIFVLMTALDDNYVALNVDGKSKVVSRNMLTRDWTGDYTLFWKVPTGYYGNMKLGAVGPTVKWLKTSLAQFEGNPLQAPPSGIFDEALAAQLLDFQKLTYLTADGIAGSETMITLNDYLYSDIPQLHSGLVDNSTDVSTRPSRSTPSASLDSGGVQHSGTFTSPLLRSTESFSDTAKLAPSASAHAATGYTGE